MPAKKGTRPPNAGKGRKKGQANKTTRAVREVLQAAVEGQQSKIAAALEHAFRTDKELWWKMLTDLLEYVTPKLQRSEVTATVAATKLERPITSAQEAADIYRQIMAGEAIDLDSVRFELPAPAPQPSPAPLSEPVVTPIAAPAPTEATEAAPESDWAKLGRAP